MENKNTSPTTCLLTQMHRNVTMGSENLSAVTPYIKDKFLLSNVTSQLESYSEFATATEALLAKHGAAPEKISPIKKAVAGAGIKLAASFDPTDRHVAQMIEKSTKKGARELENQLCDTNISDADEEAVALCKTIVDFELKESDKIKDYT
ncbi:MAG: hypothetical protein E7627_04735 [Ruminococcaceae bacterium]|nr:hypothetical protein [Oscillospiraceae bacterium]